MILEIIVKISHMNLQNMAAIGYSTMSCEKRQNSVIYTYIIAIFMHDKAEHKPVATTRLAA